MLNEEIATISSAGKVKEELQKDAESVKMSCYYYTDIHALY